MSRISYLIIRYQVPSFLCSEKRYKLNMTLVTIGPLSRKKPPGFPDGFLILFMSYNFKALQPYFFLRADPALLSRYRNLLFHRIYALQIGEQQSAA